MRWHTAVVRWAFTLITLFLHLSIAAKEKDCALVSTGVYMSISSEAEFLEETGYLRWVVVNWFGMTDIQAGDMIGVWREDPTVYPESLIEKYEVAGIDGNIMMKERWNGSLIASSVDVMEDSCLPYWAGYLRDDIILYSSCLMMRPHWMAGMKTELSEITITEVTLPGAHDAGASGHFATIIGSLVGRWTFTQDESFWQQLVLGVRYVDVRIAYYPLTEEKLFINHGDIRIAPLQIYLDHIADFMSQTEEIVIFDIHGLDVGFGGHPEREEELISVLEFNFQEWMVPKSMAPNPTLAELWKNQKRLIVTFPGTSTSQFLWSNVHHLWGDVDNLEDLKSYMDAGIPQQTGKGYLWSAMTEFTPAALDVTLDRWGGLRGAASITNSPVTSWFRNEWWSMVNIVSMDFFLSSDVVSVAVEANMKRYMCTKRNDDSCGDEDMFISMNNDIKDSITGYDNSNKPCIWLWVSALVSTTQEGQAIQRQLEINWDDVDIQEGDWVGLFDHDPNDYWSDPLDQVNLDSDMISYLTSVSFPHVAVNATMDEGACLGWWAAYIRNNVSVAVNCIKVHPRWMSAMSELIKDEAIGNIVIPGVHDSGTYTNYSAYAENPLMKYAITQDESIYNLLVYGYRYIDLRVGYFEGDPEEPYWVVHGITVWRPFKEVLREVRRFVEETNEAVIVEVGGFTFFTTLEQHKGCVALVKEEFGDVMAENVNGWETLLSELMGSSTNLIVMYNHEEAIVGDKLFWPGYAGYWGNVQTIEALEIFMVDVIEGGPSPPSPPWNMAGQLTPLAEDVIYDTLGGLRPMADSVNRNVTRWFRDRWWHTISYISCDFVLSSGYAEIAIEINQKRHQ